MSGRQSMSLDGLLWAAIVLLQEVQKIIPERFEAHSELRAAIGLIESASSALERDMVKK